MGKIGTRSREQKTMMIIENFTDFTIAQYDHPTCKVVSSFVKKNLHNSTISVPKNSIILIFNIVDDNRIPQAIFDWINSKNSSNPFYIMLVGDYDNISAIPEVVEAGLAFLAKESKLKNWRVAYVDSPIVSEDILLLNIEYLLSNQCKENTKLIYSRSFQNSYSDINTPLNDNKNWKELCALLPSNPQLKISSYDKTKLAVSLTNNHIYCQSLLYGKNSDEIEHVLELVSKIKSIIDVRIPFANLEDIDCRKFDFNHVFKLDLRGNNLKSFDFLNKFPNLVKINLGANHLRDIPIQLNSLRELQIIFIYKNQIRNIPNFIYSLPHLNHLCLYRNLVETVTDEILDAQKLKVINLGANPIKSISPNIQKLPLLKSLVLRNCKLNEIPSYVKDLNIELDLTKNYCAI